MATIVSNTQKIEKVYSKNFLLRKMMLSYYKPIVKREVKLIDELPKKILCIGGGNFPATAILFHKFTKAEVTVIDNDTSTIQTANELISRYKINEFVKVENIDGLEIDAKGYDVIHIAAQISPKDKVITQIRQTKDSNAKVIIRMPKKKLQQYYDEYDIVNQKFVKQPFFSNIGKTYIYE